MSNIGMMEGAFFVGRKEIMDWINHTLDLNLSKVEETANGAVACQLLDIMYPGQVPMHKVNWAAKQDFEHVANYKVLQTCFSKLAIERHIDVDRLISGRYMDNLEFMQWFKRFFEMGVSDKGDYDAYAQRCKGKGGAQYNNGGKRPAATKPTSGAVKSSVPSVSVAKSSAPVAPKTKPAPSSSTSAAVETKTTTNQESTVPNSVRAVSSTTVEKPSAESESVLQKEVNGLRISLEESQKSYTDLKVENEGLEKERDFYFEKLRDIEIMLQDLEDKSQGNELSRAIFKILYATTDGFEPQAEEAAAAAEESAVGGEATESEVEGEGVAVEAVEVVEDSY